MKKLFIGTLAATMMFSYSTGVADAKGKSTVKKKKVVQVDKDRNGIPDVWQKKYHLGSGKSIATKDFDKDGLNNLQEYQLNLNPKLKDTDKDKEKAKTKAPAPQVHPESQMRTSEGGRYKGGPSGRLES